MNHNDRLGHLKPTAARCLARLRHANGAWVPGRELAEVSGYRFGGRIFELRAAGFVIERRSSRTSAVDEYRIVEQRQLTLDEAVA